MLSHKISKSETNVRKRKLANIKVFREFTPNFLEHYAIFMQLMRLKTTKMLTTNNDLNNLATRVQFSSRGKYSFHEVTTKKYTSISRKKRPFNFTKKSQFNFTDK